jgi:two-component system, cell cycle sensor histidine kinase and response regulator CckA
VCGNLASIVVETGNVTLDEFYVQRYSGVLAGPYVMLAVSDTGSGIPKEILPLIFEPFFTSKGAEKGTGLGLATVYGIVKQSNGHIDVYSEINVGTTFKIYFPRVNEDESVLEPAREGEGRGGSETILLVEDEAALLEVAASLLQAAGYKVLKAEDGAAALSLAQASAEKIDLVVTDVIMPGMSGVELCNRLRELQPAIKTLYVSGYVGDQLNYHLQLAPEITLLDKPFTKESLLTRVRSILDS